MQIQLNVLKQKLSQKTYRFEKPKIKVKKS